MRQEIELAIQEACKKLFNVDETIEITRPPEQFGDYATNAALQIASKVDQKPQEVAKILVKQLQGILAKDVSEISVAGPGFINFKLSDQMLVDELSRIDKLYGKNQLYKGKTVVAEYSDPNPFKVLHAGHLYTSVVGDAIARLFEAAGGKVHRVNYGGDVGLHVAKTMWGMLHKLRSADKESLKKIEVSKRADWLAQAYIAGNEAYEKELPAKKERGFFRLEGDLPKLDILLLNHLIYDYWGEKQFANDSHQFKTAFGSAELIPTSKIYILYEIGRQWSYDYFNQFYNRLGLRFEKYYPESEVAELGLKTVKDQLSKGVFEESEGAIIFPGDKHDLHTRVFINSEGLPTYEAKEVGLILKKQADYHFDISIIITANEIAQYMQVVLKALEQFQPELVKKTIHLTHGIVKLKGGVKMSSRKGNILRAVDVLEVAESANHKVSGKEQPAIVLGAVKYAFLKQGLGGDIVYDPEESVAITGDSGPYLQYAHARARSILHKATKKTSLSPDASLNPAERSLLRKMTEFPEVVSGAVEELAPHHVCTYLYELAQSFNRFYEGNRVIGDKREELRLKLVQSYALVLENGLELLNIQAPEKM